MSKPKPKTRQPTQDDILRLGNEVATIKSQADPKAWKALVKRAHAGGFTVAGELSGGPAALKERTQSSLKAQAQKSIDTAYAPAAASLDADQGKIAAWDTKRKQDNAAYEVWLGAQREKQNTQLVGATDAIIKANQAARDAATAQVIPAQGSPAAQAAVDAGHQRDVGLIGNAADSSNAIVAAGVEHAKEMGSASLAQAGAREAARYADTSKANQDIIDKKSALTINKAKDYLSEFARLTTEQGSIASSNRDSRMLGDKLDIQQGTLDLGNAKLDQTKVKDAASIAATKEANHIKSATVRMQRNKKDYNNDGKVDAQDRLDKVQDAKDVKAAPSAAKTTDGKPTAGAVTLSTTKIGALSRVYGLLTDLHNNPPTVGEGKGKHKLTPDKFRHYLTGTLKGGASSLMIDLAEDARTHGGRLSAAGRKKARQAGILNPENLQL